MKFTKKHAYIAIISVIVLAAIYFFFIRNSSGSKKNKKDPFAALLTDDKKVIASSEEEKAKLIAAVENDPSFPLKFGKTGKRVEQAQEYAKQNEGAAFTKHGTNGVWDKETEAEIMKAFKRNNISKAFFIKKEMYLMPTQEYA